MTNFISSLRPATRALAIAILLGSSFLGFSASAADQTAQQTTQAAPATTSPSETPAPATRSEVEGYAVREQANQALQKFQGGDTVVVVGGTTVVIVLLVVLILVLI